MIDSLVDIFVLEKRKSGNVVDGFLSKWLYCAACQDAEERRGESQLFRLPTDVESGSERRTEMWVSVYRPKCNTRSGRNGKSAEIDCKATRWPRFHGASRGL